MPCISRRRGVRPFVRLSVCLSHDDDDYDDDILIFFFFILARPVTIQDAQLLTELVTELLQMPVPGYGTVYRHISEMLTYRTVGSGGH